MDSFLPSAGNYKINIKINNTSLDECSFAGLNDKLRVSFDESISNDPDVTALMVYLKNVRGEIAGWKVIYQLDPDTKQDIDSFEKGISEETDQYPENDDEEITDNTDVSGQTETVLNNDNEININVDVNKSDNENEIEDADKDDDISNNDTGISENENDSETEKTEDVAASNPSAADLKENENINDKVFQLPLSYNNGDELIITVKSLDNLPFFPIPDDLPAGQYVVVSSIMSNEDVLQKIEKTFFYLSGKKFTYNGINVNLPGITESNQLIPRGMLIMLEVDIDFDVGLEPYVEWYNGRKKIAEGKLSGGAGYFFWKAPEESGFYSIRAVVYPIEKFKNLSGYQKDVSLLVSAKTLDIHLVKDDAPQLLRKYIFEGNLNDSKSAQQTGIDYSFKHDRGDPKWKAFDGTYGVVTGNNNNIRMSKIILSEKETEDWQLLFRFKPENDGGILTVQFGKAINTFMHLYIEGSYIVLVLTSPSGTVSQIYNLNRRSASDIKIAPNDKPAEENVSSSETGENALLDDEEFISLSEEAEVAEPVRTEIIKSAPFNDGSFIVAGIRFSYRDGFLSAQLNILGDSADNELAGKPIVLEIENINEFQVVLGFLRSNNLPADILPVVRLGSETQNQTAIERNEFTAIWDEFALYYGQKKEKDTKKTKLPSNEKPVEFNALEIEESSQADYN